MNKEAFFEEHIIRQFVNGELQEPVLKAFQEELSINEDLQMEVDLFAFLIADYKIKKKNHFKTLIPNNIVIEVPKEEEEIKLEKKSDLHTLPSKIKEDRTIVEEPKKEYTLWPRLIKFAAAAMFLAAIGLGWFALNNQGGNYTQLATNYLEEPYAPPVVNRGEAQDVEQLWQEAIIAYKNKKFGKSTQLIEKIIEQNQGKDIHYFYFGLSHLYQKEAHPQEAIKAFERVGKGHYWESSKWYESLAHLQLNNTSKAKGLLEGLKNSSRKTEVEKLLKSL